MNRLFVFGCSFTSYIWPTWADMLGIEFPYYENWAISNTGNRAIAERVAECNAKNKFTEQDTVIVQWSSHTRHDWFIDEKDPITEENIGWAVNRVKGRKPKFQKLVDYIYSDKAYSMNTLNFVSMIQALLEQTKCKWFMTSIGDLRNLGYDTIFSDKLEDIKLPKKKIKNCLIWELYPELKCYEHIWTKYSNNWLNPIFPTVIENKNYIWKFEKDNYIDFHPTMFHHNLWLEQNLKNKLNINYQYDAVRNQMVELSNRIKSKSDYGLEKFSITLEKATKKLLYKHNLDFQELEKKVGF